MENLTGGSDIGKHADRGTDSDLAEAMRAGRRIVLDEASISPRAGIEAVKTHLTSRAELLVQVATRATPDAPGNGEYQYPGVAPLSSEFIARFGVPTGHQQEQPQQLGGPKSGQPE